MKLIWSIKYHLVISLKTFLPTHFIIELTNDITGYGLSIDTSNLNLVEKRQWVSNMANIVFLFIFYCFLNSYCDNMQFFYVNKWSHKC